MIRYWPFLMLLLVGCTEKKKPALAGLWKNLAVEQQDENGRWQKATWMRDGTGYLHYDDDRTMSLHFVPQGYTDLREPEHEIDKWDIDVLTGFASDYWYLASYRLTGEDSVHHTRILHANPEEIGMTATRLYRFSGDTLILSAPEHGLRLKWIRVQ